jgi:hypothetical protein
VTAPTDETALARILDAFGRELIEAPDEEVREAARELGMNLSMKESAAFAGLTYPSRPQLSDFFEIESFKQMVLEAAESATPETTRPSRARTPRRIGRRRSRHKRL